MNGNYFIYDEGEAIVVFFLRDGMLFSIDVDDLPRSKYKAISRLSVDYSKEFLQHSLRFPDRLVAFACPLLFLEALKEADPTLFKKRSEYVCHFI